MAIEITDSNFEEIVIKSIKPVLVDFWAPWCAPCRMLMPIIEELSKEYEGRVTIGKVSVDDNPAISMKYGIRSLPTILFFKDGNIAPRVIQNRDKQTLRAILNGLL